ncbi:CHAT domain-containing protein [Marinoscillum pacificum]|uniref:CHAT domain-containing protein n=1 Tax=Marinoscillum pacificum TaxID=392723 RepID=UPI002157B268|nr:CHAT domain-containing protein [Marinoscillum pacificum]
MRQTVKLSFVWFLIGVCSSVYSQDKKFEKAVQDYYKFQYVSSINGFDSFLERDDLIGIKANYYTAMSFYEHGYTSEGLNYAVQSLDVAAAKYGESSPEAVYGYIGYGKYYHEMQSYDTAKLFYRAALELVDPSNRTIVGEIFCNLAYAMDYNGEYDSALVYYQKAADQMEQSLGLIHPYTDWVYSSIPYVAQHSEQYETQVNTALKSLDIKRQLRGEESEDYVLALKEVTVAYEWLEDFSQMDIYASRLLEYGKSFYGERSNEYANYLRIRGNAQLAKQEYSKAFDSYKSSYLLLKEIAGNKDENTLLSLDALADAYYSLGDFAIALDYYIEYLNAVKKSANLSVQIEKMEDIAQCYERMGKLEDAKDLYQQALEKKNPDYLNQIPRSYIALARIAERYQNYTAADDYLDKAISANNRYNSGDNATYSFILNNRGVLLQNQNKFADALKLFEQALTIRKELFGEDSREYAQTSNGLGNVYHLLGNNQLALEYFQKTLLIEQSEYGVNHHSVASTLVNIANCYSELDQHFVALKYLKSAEQILDKYDFGPALISVYSNLIISYIELSQTGDAENYLKKHHDLVTKLYGDFSLDLAKNYNLKGMLLHEGGETELSFLAFKNAIDIYEKLGLKESLNMASVLNNVGVANLEYHAYSEAKDYFDEALRIYETILPKDHHEIITTKMNLALVDDGKRNYKRAIEQYDEILNGFTTGKLDTINAATTLQNKAIAEQMLGLTEQSILSTTRAIELLSKKLGENNSSVAGLNNNLGNQLIANGQLDKAKSAFSVALQFYKANDEMNGQIRVYLGLAEIATNRGDFMGALNLLDEALKLKTDPEVTLNQTLLFSSLVAQVDVYYQLYHKEKSIDYLQKSLESAVEANKQLGLAESEIINEEDRVQFSVYKSLLTNIGVKAAVGLYQEAGDQSYISQAFYYAEKSKANVLLQSIQESNIRTIKGVDRELLKKERELRYNIEKLEQEVFKLTGREDERNKMQMLSSRLFDQKRTYQEVVTDLRNNPKYRQLNASLEISSIKRIQDRLNNGEAVIEFAPGDSTLITFIITKSDIAVFSAVYDEKFSGLVTAIRNAIIFKSDAAFDYVSNKIYEVALAEVETYFDEQNLAIDQLTIVPEGSLNYFPFESLKRNGRYLIEDYQIKYSYSTTLSGLLTDRENKSNGQILSFAPVFADQSTSRLTPGALDVFEASRSVASEEFRGFSANGEFISALPGTKEEVDAIYQLATNKGRKAELLVYDQAKEEVIKSGILGEYEFIHFATHGFVNESNPSYSGVFMSQNDNSNEDCVLFSAEIYNLEINADLVTLSACETGLGRYAEGEGIVGLTRSFFYAGAKNMLVSQWQVSDASTAKMMVDFYDGLLSGETKSAALRNAKLNLIKSEEYKKPYYWAPFVLIGE